MAARRQALRLAARALEQRLNADTSDHAGSELPCACGAPAQYHGRHGKTFESVLGPLLLERAYYHCAQCQSGFCPRDHHLHLEMFSLTPGVLRMTGSAAALVSFVESSDLLRELAGVEVSASQVERAAEALGAEIASDEHNCVEPTGDVAPTMYLGMDGTGVPMRNSELAGRPVSNPMAPQKPVRPRSSPSGLLKHGTTRASPCGIRDRSPIRPRLKVQQPRTPTRLGSYFAERVLREATRRNFTKAPRCAVLGDGSAWIWNTAKELFPQACQRNPSPHRSGDLWYHQRRGQTMGHGALYGTG